MKFTIVILLTLVTISPGTVYQAVPDTMKAYIVENDSTLATRGKGPHGGKGNATASVFFRSVQDLGLSFQKHVLHVGAEVGYHKQTRDEVYYIVSGTGIMVVNGTSFSVKPGDAILTRKGNYHGMQQVGTEDLVFIVAYPKN
ncbi:MAG: cupin domain-containing protein [Bacteroidetes bacterium]|nr:cupin domain-containing protein [Bacteroidota bacterium]